MDLQGLMRTSAGVIMGFIGFKVAGIGSCSL